MACNPKDYDGKGGAIVYTRWIEKMESVQDMIGFGENQKVKYTADSFIGKVLIWWNSQVQTRGREAVIDMTWEDFKTLTTKEFCPNNEMQKLETEFWCHVMVGAGHAAYTDRFHELARLVPHLVTPENKRIERYIYGLNPQIRGKVAATEPTTIQSVVLKVIILTDEAIRNGAMKKITEKRGNNGEPSRDGNSRDDNKRSMTRRAFATITNPIKKDQRSNWVENPLNARNPTATRGVCFKCGGANQYKAACPRLNRAPTPGGNRPNQVMAIEGGQSSGNNGNQARRRAFVIGVNEACQDPNIVTGTFTLNNHYATTLFDSGADYSFVFTTFILVLDIEPNNLGFSYEIEIANGQLVEINKGIRGCKLDIEGHIFDIDLIPFGHGSFDLIVRMDWLSRERPEEKVRHLLSVKVKEQTLKDIVLVRNFSEVFPDDLSGLPPSREIKFRIDLILGAMPIVKSPYRLTPSKMEELSSQLREL
ncbi:putative reverse transcriptase domain-containing protein [Tanacetum coccineum]